VGQTTGLGDGSPQRGPEAEYGNPGEHQHWQGQYCSSTQSFECDRQTDRQTDLRIGVARACTGCTCKIFSGPYLQGKVVSAPPDRECTPEAVQQSNFLRKLGRFRRWERLFR